jgi:RNA polymerase sigma-70 factor (ECF subfamily)
MDERSDAAPGVGGEARPGLRDRGREERRQVARIARGDREALAAVYRRFKDDLLSVAGHLLGERAAAEDVLHDVFVALARRAGELRLEGSLRAYLVGSCLNRARDLRRRRRPERAGGARLAALADPGGAADERASRADDARRVARLLAGLPDAQREVVCLRVFGGLTLVEIAALTSTSPNTAQSRWRYAVAALRPRLAAEPAPAAEAAPAEGVDA